MRGAAAALLCAITIGAVAPAIRSARPLAAPVASPSPRPPPSPVVASLPLPGDTGTVALGVDARAGRVVLFTGPNHPFLSTLDARDGRVVRRIALGGVDETYRVAFDAAAGLAITIAQGSNAAFATLYDDRTLDAVGSVRVASYATLVRVDEARGRLFVLNGPAQNVPDPGAINTVSVVDLHPNVPLPRVLRPVGSRPTSADALVGMDVDAATGRLVLVTESGRGNAVLLVDPTTGAVAHRTPTVLDPGDWGQTRAFAYIYPPVAWVFPRLRRVFARFGHMLVVIDADSGRIVRTLTLRHAVGSLVADERAGRVFGVAVGAGDETSAVPRRVDVFDGRSGDLLTSTVTGGDIQLIGRVSQYGDPPAPGVLDARTGRFFVTTIHPVANAGPVDMFDTRSGTLVLGQDLPAAPILALDARAGRVLALETLVHPGTGSLAVLDAHTGAVVATYAHALPGHFIDALAVAVDEDTHRAFVVGDNGALIVLNTASS